MTIQPDVALSDWCTLGVGGAARWFCAARDEQTIADALQWADERSVPVHVLGGGSNVVCADQGFDGLVLHVGICGVTVTPDGDRVVVAAGAGEPWDPLVARVVERGMAGLECLSGIPGQVGGTPIQNVGAYGQDVSATITSVRALERQHGGVIELSNESCAFGYRTSRFKREDRGRFVVTRVEFELTRGSCTLAYAEVREYFERAGMASPTVQDVRAAVLAIRRRKGMIIEPDNPARQSVGSFFVNPVIARSRFVELVEVHPAMQHYRVSEDAVKVPAAWLIEHAGFPRGTRHGPVGVSPLQAQAIINRGGATADDVLGLAVAIKTAVWRTFHIAMVPEPVFIGFNESPALSGLLETDPDGASCRHS